MRNLTPALAEEIQYTVLKNLVLTCMGNVLPLIKTPVTVYESNDWNLARRSPPQVLQRALYVFPLQYQLPS